MQMGETELPETSPKANIAPITQIMTKIDDEKCGTHVNVNMIETKTKIKRIYYYIHRLR